MIYPWQHEQWSQLQRERGQSRLSHALLLTGPQGLGKLQFAQRLVQLLLCTRADEGPCGHCEACRLYTAGSHPDFREITPEQDSDQIKIDQIRALVAFAGLSRHGRGYKVALIAPAERLNRNAANSLLKTLEEPPAQSCIVLVSAQPSRLPATLRSRCQQIIFHPPAKAEGVQWLSQALPGVEAPALLLSLGHGAPLAARGLAEGKLLEARRSVFESLLGLREGRGTLGAAAKACAQLDTALLLDWLISWLADVVRLCHCADTGYLDNPDLYQQLCGLAGKVDLQSAYRALDHLLETKKISNAALNPQLMIEDLLLAWAGIGREYGVGHYGG
jgi:DNA polymerase-3 subunit delta'